MGIKGKLIISLVVILFSGFSIINIVNYKISKDTTHENLVHESLPIISNNIYSEIQKDLTRPIYASSIMANDTFVKDWILDGEKDVERIKKYLLEIKNKYNFVSTFLVSCRTGNYYHFNGLHKKISPDDQHDSWFYDFLKLDVEYDLDVDTDEAFEDQLTVFINHRLLGNDGSLIGVIGVGLSIKQISALLLEYQGEFKRNICLIEPGGLVQAHTDIQQVETINIFHQEEIEKHKDKILSTINDPYFFEFDRDGKHILLITRYIPEMKWYLLVEQDETTTLANFRINLFQNLFIGFVITCIIVVINVFTVSYFQNKLELMAAMDSLTGASNQKTFREMINAEFNRSRRYKTPLSLLMLDLDHFKRINDTYGHSAGDVVLRIVVQECRKIIRDVDNIGRLGGDEFAILLVETSLANAENVGTRINKAVSELEIVVNNEIIRTSASIGLTQLTSEDQSGDDLMEKADQALYKAKSKGRNCVEIKDTLSPKTDCNPPRTYAESMSVK